MPLRLRVFVLVRRPLAFVPFGLVFLEGFAHDPPIVGDLGRIVSDSDFVVKELAANVADQSHQFASFVEESAVTVKVTDSFGQRAKHCFEVARPTLVVRLFLLHRDGRMLSAECDLRDVLGCERCYDGTQVAQGKRRPKLYRNLPWTPISSAFPLVPARCTSSATDTAVPRSFWYTDSAHAVSSGVTSAPSWRWPTVRPSPSTSSATASPLGR